MRELDDDLAVIAESQVSTEAASSARVDAADWWAAYAIEQDEDEVEQTLFAG